MPLGYLKLIFNSFLNALGFATVRFLLAVGGAYGAV